jgi:hypothetical protein
LKRTGAGATPILVGTVSGASVFAADSSMTACTVSPAVGSSGPNVIVTGIPAIPIEWAYTFQVVTAD